MEIKWVCSECSSNNVKEDSQVLECSVCHKIRTTEILLKLDGTEIKIEQPKKSLNIIEKIKKCFSKRKKELESERSIDEMPTSDVAEIKKAPVLFEDKSSDSYAMDEKLWPSDEMKYRLNTGVIAEKKYIFIGKQEKNGTQGYLFKDQNGNERFFPSKTCFLIKFFVEK